MKRFYRKIEFAFLTIVFIANLLFETSAVANLSETINEKDVKTDGVIVAFDSYKQIGKRTGGTYLELDEKHRNVIEVTCYTPSIYKM